MRCRHTLAMLVSLVPVAGRAEEGITPSARRHDRRPRRRPSAAGLICDGGQLRRVRRVEGQQGTVDPSPGHEFLRQRGASLVIPLPYSRRPIRRRPRADRSLPSNRYDGFGRRQDGIIRPLQHHPRAADTFMGHRKRAVRTRRRLPTRSSRWRARPATRTPHSRSGCPTARSKATSRAARRWRRSPTSPAPSPGPRATSRSGCRQAGCRRPAA